MTTDPKLNPDVVTPEVIPPDPGKLTPEGFTPASSLLLKRNITNLPPTADSATTIKRGPGRPRGSTNQPKADDKKDPIKEAIDKRIAKEKRVHELKTKMVGEFNDQLMALIIDNTPLQSGMIYKPGKAPVGTQDDRYTDLGSQLAINPFTAHCVAHVITELEFSDKGQAVTSVVTGGPVAVGIYGILGVASVLMYLKGVKEVVDRAFMLQRAYEQSIQNNNGNPNLG